MQAPSHLRLLRNPNYRAYFIGLSITSAGTWMQTVVQAWLVYRLSKSAFWLGMIPVCQNATAIVMTVVAGVLCDRMQRRRILIAVQVVALLQAVALATLVMSGRVQVWHVLIMAAVLGMCSGIDITTRHAFAVDLVEKEDLPAAIALNAVVQNGARIAGPVGAAMLIGPLGEAGCFFLNAATFIPQIIALTWITPRPSQSRQAGHPLQELSEGLRYALGHSQIRKMIALCGLLCLFASPYSTLLPVIAKRALDGDARTLGWLGAAMGLGAVCGTFLVSPRKNERAIDLQLAARAVFWGVFLAALALSKTLWLSLSAQFGIGFCMMSIFPIMNSTIQFAVPDAMRGRVLSLYTMTFIGLVPVGALAMGALSDRFGAPAVVACAGALTLCLGAGLAACAQKVWPKTR